MFNISWTKSSMKVPERVFDEYFNWSTWYAFHKAIGHKKTKMKMRTNEVGPFY